VRPLVVLAAVASAIALLAPAVAAARSSPSGGVAYGASVPIPDARPIAQRLKPLPRELTAGDPVPAISVRVRQRGVARVRARLVVVRLPSNRPVARLELGRMRTGRALTARLPASLQLRTGRYLVRLHAKDPRGRTLRRSGAHPGRARITVHRPKPAPAPAPAPVLLPAPAASPGGPGVFPVAGAFDFGAAGSRFGAGRPGHIHEGQDIAAMQGTPVVAPYAGVVSQTSYQEDGAGEYAVLDAVDGRDYFFAHCQHGSTAVPRGATVAAGAPLCRVGMTGGADGPHLHFEIWTVGWRVPGGAPIDPLPELQTWAAAR
jgi:murein DD-endopeptidase MepM/ murein hydrolase activator NlpD